MDDTSLYDLQPGDLVAGRFRVLSPSRHGEFASVYAVDEETADAADGTKREMHLFMSGVFEGDKQARDFAASMRPWTRVDSPSVLRVREVVPVATNNFLLITDAPEGTPLREALEAKERLEPHDAVSIGRRALEGLVEIHTHGLVHGDVKPTTIYVAGEPGARRISLIDGGITPGLWSAKNLGDKTALIGTPFYAPIEQFGGDSPDVQSDVYNVATVMFELLTGVLPWPGRTFLEVFQAKLAEAKPSMQARAPGVEVDPALEDAVVTGLVAVKSSRYATARELLDRLAPFEQ